MPLIEPEALAAGLSAVANASLQESDQVSDGHGESSGEVPEEEKCVKYRTLGIYLSTSAITYLVSVLLVVLVRLAMAPFKRRMQQRHSNASRAAAAQRRGLRAFGGLAGGLTHSNGAFALPAGADGKKFVPSEPSMYSSVQDWAGDLISGNNATGRFLVVFAFCCSIASFLIYVYDTVTFHALEICEAWQELPSLQVDFAMAIFFLVYFFIRFIAAEDKLMHLVTMESIVDFLTLPPIFLSVYLNRAWLGLRFLRALIFLSLPDILVYIRVINTSTSIRLAQLLCKFIAVILSSAGMCLYLENSGDPWRNFSNPHDPYLSFGDCLYLMFITISTVGYGDVTCTTDWGKVFIVFYISGALSLMANNLPEVARLLGHSTRYLGAFRSEGRQFVIVAGNINYESVQTFLADFFHPARDDTDVAVVFLNKEEPSLEFEGFLKREHTRVQYFRGSMLNAFDLQRVCAEKASACLILCNKFCDDPDAEDAANIMRVISLKNYCEDTRVVIQLMMYHNKSFLLNVPGWDWRRDDQAVCQNELKLGFIAQSCLAPGFSTLVSNLIIIGSTDMSEVLKPSRNGGEFGEVPKWKRDYFKSCNKFVVAETLSPTFIGMQFSKVAEICYTQLNLLLIAIEGRKYEGGHIYINPKDKVINPNAVGLFLTDTSESAKRAWFYCQKCHAHIKSEKQVVKCDCKLTAVRQVAMDRPAASPAMIPPPPAFAMTTTPVATVMGHTSGGKLCGAHNEQMSKHRVKYIAEGSNGNIRRVHIREMEACALHTAVAPVAAASGPSSAISSSSSEDLSKLRSRRRPKMKSAASVDAMDAPDPVPAASVGDSKENMMRYDATGMYHWCPNIDIGKCLIGKDELQSTEFSDHIVLAVFANEDSQMMGLRNLVMPLRASNIHYSELLVVIILGNVDYIKKEWRLLQNLPKIRVYNGNPLSRADLRSVKIDTCRLCVVLSAKVPTKVEPVLADKEVLLTALNIKAMKFDDEEEEDEFGGLATGADYSKAPCSAGSSSPSTMSPCVTAVESKTEKLKRRRMKLNSILGELLDGNHGRANKKPPKSVPIIVDLAFASNVRFLDDHELHIDNIDLYKTLPFAAGQAVARGLFDSLMSTTYFNASALRLIRAWVTGGATIELELALAEGAGLRGGYSTPQTLAKRDRFRMAHIPLLGSAFSTIAEEGYPFGTLFAEAASKYGMLCIGLYRKLKINCKKYAEETSSTSKSKKAEAELGGGLDSDDNLDANLDMDPFMRIVIAAPDKNMPVEREDIAFMLVQYEPRTE